MEIARLFRAEARVGDGREEARLLSAGWAGPASERGTLLVHLRLKSRSAYSADGLAASRWLNGNGACRERDHTLMDRSMTWPEGLIQTINAVAFLFLARVRISLSLEAGRSTGVLFRKRFRSRRLLKY